MRKLYMGFYALLLGNALILSSSANADLSSLNNASSKFAPQACRGCERPDRGPPGPTGPQGEPGGFINFFNFNTFTDDEAPDTTIDPDVSIPFNAAAVSSGTVITQPADEQFGISATGNYLVTFTGITDETSSVGGSVQFELNGSLVGPSSILVLPGSTIVLQAILDVATAPSTLEVVVLDTAITFAAGTSATISIVQLSTP